MTATRRGCAADASVLIQEPAMRIRSVFVCLSLLACACAARAKSPQPSGTTHYYNANGTSAGSSRSR